MAFRLAAPPRTALPGRLLRYLVAPAAAGVLIGFALLWLGGERGASVAGGVGDTAAGPVGGLPQADGFADAVERAAPAVVNILSRRLAQLPSYCRLPQYRLLCEMYRTRGRRLEGILGSGVVVREAGYLLTNYHVVAAGDDIRVAFHDGTQMRAAVVGADPDTDLAVLKVDGEGLVAIEHAPATDIRVGDIVLAIGNPFGIGQAVSLGIVSAKGRYGPGDSAYDDFIQTDAAINPGNSGGALVDRDGRLVGINTFIYSRSGGSEGVGLAIPAARALDVLEQILEHGRVLRGFLGVGLSEAPPADRPGGLTVVRVYAGTPAHAAGLLPGDLLLSIDGEPARTARAVTRKVMDTAPGTPMVIRFMRNGAVRVVTATAGVSPQRS